MLDGRNSICYFSITDIYIVVKLQHIITYVCSVCSRLNYLSYQHVFFSNGISNYLCKHSNVLIFAFIFPSRQCDYKKLHPSGRHNVHLHNNSYHISNLLSLFFMILNSVINPS